MAKTVLVTGATAGFGEAIARKFVGEGHRVVITGRRMDRLQALVDELNTSSDRNTYPLCFDVRDNDAVISAIASLPEAWSAIDVLVNNAGLASGLATIQEGDLEDWNKMIDTNVKGLLHVSKAVMPGMIKRQSGHIINIGSTAGKEVYEKGNIYCATKHAVDAITKGMRIDLLGTGIKVTQIAPGAAETEFSIVRFHGDEARAKSAYNGYEPMSADDVALVTYFAATLPPNLCINDMVLTSLSQANSFYINRQES